MANFRTKITLNVFIYVYLYIELVETHCNQEIHILQHTNTHTCVLYLHEAYIYLDINT